MNLQSPVSVTPSEHTGLISLAGALDAAAHDRVRAALGAALAYAGARRYHDVVVDVAGVRFIDAGTIRMLVGAHRTAAGAGRRFRLTGVRDTVRRAIVASGSAPVLLPYAEADTGPRPALVPRLLLGDGADDLARASAERQRAEDDQVRIRARIQQQAVDGEVRATRRTLLADLREQLRTRPRALISDDFLALADPETVYAAILMAATIVGGADACELRLEDKYGTVWRRGFGDDPFPVVHAYTLRTPDGQVAGILALHFRSDERPGEPELVAECAETALSFTDRPGMPAPPG
ncbi:STAS domain-containing protein [Actinoplanes sp. LDG1-06]|uniref:STAS domain-containing protein n=1 Tax=Paractinoplanes ovalisporus TaxID=2810368 RepID=A0ABS2AJ53_9ACTN|nr:STAS domain-containing protein [Actinoplanes ovalisporus]MBM2619872.1 STAS domain-containing protein [Actinoplanes ovalisporus]